VEVTRIDEGLWRWTTPHPEWKTGDDWDEDVGCVYWEGDDATVLVDPLIPTSAGERHRFLDALDRDVKRRGLPVAILRTCAWHARSTEELAERYDGRVLGRSELDLLPTGVAAVPAPAAEEVVYWLGPARTVVPGDVLLGAPGGLTLCPASWLQSRGGLPQLARDLTSLLELPVERVLPSHGPPVLEGARDALASVLGRG
jgi:glyoxylase-like metal-dependent hydrolase (beta-lactamase superfamily II)